MAEELSRECNSFNLANWNMRVAEQLHERLKLGVAKPQTHTPYLATRSLLAEDMALPAVGDATK
eukprot:1076521-Pelagomonas_calceolata.AAC.1